MARAGALTVGITAFALGAVAVLGQANVRLPGDRQDYAPAQPIAYSHRLHAGEMGMDCLYCHFAAETSRRAGIPPAQVCMNCHAAVTASWDVTLAERQAALKEEREPRRIVSDRLRPLYDALGLGDDGRPDPSKTPAPIRWVRVHSLPEHASFHHGRHVARGVACQACHGPVESMERVRQFAPLTMGWCMDCHRANAAEGTGVTLPPVAERAEGHVSTDCSGCHR